MSEPTEVQDAVASTLATPFAQPIITASKSKAQKQREYRQRIAASRTPAQAAAARKSNNERQRNKRLRQAASLALLPARFIASKSLETTAAPKTRAQIQREYRQRIAASKTPVQAAAAREARNVRDRNNRLRQAANLVIASGALEATTTSPSRSGQRLFNFNEMNSKFYKYCMVPQCENTTVKTPKKLFIYVPNKIQIRKKWLVLAGRDSENLSRDSRMYFCEDHFDLPNDMENYMQYHVMGSVSQIRLKPGCIPTKFDCQPNRKIQACSCVERPYIQKKQTSIDNSLNQSLKSSTGSVPKAKIAKKVKNKADTANKELSDDLDESDDNLSMYSKDKKPKSIPRKTSEATGDKVDQVTHEGFRCHVCNGEITGFRYTCVQCSDFDLCGACENNNKHEQHYVLRVPAPRPVGELDFVLTTIRRHLMKGLDPIKASEQDWHDDISIKCEVKSEHEDDDYNMEPTPGHESDSSDTSAARGQTDNKDITTTTIVSIKEEPYSDSPDEYDIRTPVLATPLADATPAPVILIDAGKIMNMPHDTSCPQLVKRGLREPRKKEAETAKKKCIRPAMDSDSNGNEPRSNSQSIYDVQPDTKLIEVTVPPASTIEPAKPVVTMRPLSELKSSNDKTDVDSR